MSRSTLARLPEHVRCALQLYEREISSREPIHNQVVRQHLQTTSSAYLNFSAQKLLRANLYNTQDFSPLVAKSISPIFDSPILLDDLENLSTDELFKAGAGDSETADESIVSQYSRSAKHTTDYAAKIITSFASYYTPRKNVPKKASIEGVYRWFVKLLQNTPVVMVLKQRNTLYSDSSLSQINNGASDLRIALKELCNREFPYSPERNYHFTELSYVDMFQLAIRQQVSLDQDSAGSGSTESSPIDALANILYTEKDIHWLNNHREPVPESKVLQFLSKNHPNVLAKKAVQIPVKQIFPFDISYNDYYLLSIESPVVHVNHEQLLEIVANSEFELVAARMSLSHPLISSFFHQERENLEPGHNYEKLLELARKSRTPIDSVHDLVGRLGSQGLVSLSEGCDKGSVYLTPEPTN